MQSLMFLDCFVQKLSKKNLPVSPLPPTTLVKEGLRNFEAFPMQILERNVTAIIQKEEKLPSKATEIFLNKLKN